MPTLEPTELYPSPYSERLRWVLELKGLSYDRTPHVPVANESAHTRSMFGIPFGDDPTVAPLRRWRDDTYRRHRGRRVVPPAA